MNTNTGSTGYPQQQQAGVGNTGYEGNTGMGGNNAIASQGNMGRQGASGEVMRGSQCRVRLGGLHCTASANVVSSPNPAPLSELLATACLSSGSMCVGFWQCCLVHQLPLPPAESVVESCAAATATCSPSERALSVHCRCHGPPGRHARHEPDGCPGRRPGEISVITFLRICCHRQSTAQRSNAQSPPLGTC